MTVKPVQPRCLQVYLETSVVSYLAARPSRDLVTAAHQAVTGEWWETRRQSFKLFCSELVLREARAGDVEVAERRLRLLEGIPLVDLTDEVSRLAAVFLQKSPLPENAVDDAIHLAAATVHGLDCLLTWNCRHIANAEIVPLVRLAAEGEGYGFPDVCTPEELMGVSGNEEGPDS